MKIKYVYFFAFLIVLATSVIFYFQKKPKKISLIISGILQGNLSSPKEIGNEKNSLSGGVLFLGSYGKKLKKECRDSGSLPIWIDNGDNISGTPDAYYTHGEAIINALGKIPFDAVMLGNREFDYGKNTLFNLISQYGFFIGSNIIMETEKEKYPFKHIIKIPLGNGKNALILGITPPDTPVLTLKNNIKGLKFLSLKETLKKYKSDIKKSSFIIVITQFTMSDVDKRLNMFEQYGKIFFVVINVYDFNVTKPVKLSDRVYLLPHYGQSRGEVIEKMDLKLNGDKVLDLDFSRFSKKKCHYQPDGKIAQVVDDYRRRVDKIISEEIGRSTMDFKIDNFNEMALGSMIADWLINASGADICMINSNSMRVGLNKGSITREDLYRAFPFDNYWILLKMKGKQILKTIKSCYLWKKPVFQLGGCNILVDPNAKDPLISMKINGNEIDPEKEYKVVTNSFLAQGGDGYIEFFKSPIIKEGQDIRRLVEENIKKYSPISAKIKNRIIIQKKGDEKK